MFQVNSYNNGDMTVPFGGYKQSGIGRELGEYALEKYVTSTLLGKYSRLTVYYFSYTSVKGVHINTGFKL